MFRRKEWEGEKKKGDVRNNKQHQGVDEIKIKEGSIASLVTMRALTWNSRGLNAPGKRYLIKRQLDQTKVDLAFLQETKIKMEEKCY